MTLLAIRKLRVVAGCALAMGLLGLTPQPSEAALHGRAFETKADNIGCRLGRGRLRCDVQGELNPEPKRKCDFDWAALVLEADGKAEPWCVSDTIRYGHPDVLRPGHKWRRKGIVCRAGRASLRCHNRKHHGFSVSRNDWDTF